MKKLFYLTILLIVCSCGTKSKETADIDVSQSKTVEIDEKERVFDLIENVRYTKLETPPEALIGPVDRIVIDSAAGVMFLFDRSVSGSIFAYDTTGRFVAKIGIKGRGPGEYIEIQDFDIDPLNRQIQIMDLAGRKFLYYTYDGKFVRNRKLDCLGSEFEAQGPYILYHTDGSVSKNKEIEGAQFVLCDTLTGTLSPFRLSEISPDLSYTVSQKMYKNGDTITFSPRFSHAVYRLEGGQVSQMFRLAMPDAMPAEALKTADDKQFKKLSSQYQYMESYILTPVYSYFQIMTPKGIYRVFRSSTTEKIIGGKEYVLNDDNPLSALLFIPAGGYGNKLIEARSASSVLSAKEMLYGVVQNAKSEQGKRILDSLYENLQEDDNPVVFFFELKAF